MLLVFFHHENANARVECPTILEKTYHQVNKKTSMLFSYVIGCHCHRSSSLPALHSLAGTPHQRLHAAPGFRGSLKRRQVLPSLPRYIKVTKTKVHVELMFWVKLIKSMDTLQETTKKTDVAFACRRLARYLGLSEFFSMPEHYTAGGSQQPAELPRATGYCTVNMFAKLQ